MKIPKLKKHEKIDLKWLDTYDPELPSWASDEEIKIAIDKEDVIANSRGYFYCVDRGHLYIYGDKLDKTYSRITGIPIGTIIEIKRSK